MANEHSQIVPSMQPTATVADFKFWCQKVLPLVYDDSLSYYEVLNKMVVYLNQVIDNINADIENVEELEDDFLLLQTYVNNFFDDIDQLVTYTERAEAAELSAISYAASAAESASNAASSASNAATSSGSAATSALSALDAKDAAVAAKTAAETALASAQTAATNAAASATTASGAAINAQTSASAASTSATLAGTAADNAHNDAIAAQNAADDAQDVLDSIPDDYMKLSSEVDAHSEQIVDLSNAKRNFKGMSYFDSYGLDTEGAFLPSQRYRVSCEDSFTLSYPIVVSVKNGFKWGYIPFTNGVKTGSWSEWRTVPTSIPAGAEFVVQIARVTEDTSEIADVDEFLNALTFETEFATPKVDVLDYTQLTSADFTVGSWEDGVKNVWNKRLAIAMPFPVMSGDKLVYNTNQLEMHISTYPIGFTWGSSSTTIRGWHTVNSETEITFTENAMLVISFKKSNGAEIAPTDYDATIKVYSGKNWQIENVLNNQYVLIDSTKLIWEVGSISNQGIDSSANAIRCAYYDISVFKSLLFTPKNSIVYGIHIYDENFKQIFAYPDWINYTIDYSVPANAKYLRINILNENDVAALLLYSNLTIQGVYDGLKVMNEIGAGGKYGNGNAVGFGERINISEMKNNPWSCNIEQYIAFDPNDYPDLSSYGLINHQSFAIYGGYIFLLQEGGTIVVVDYETKSIVAEFDSPITTYNHQNSAQFSKYFYTAEDTFPLLFVARCGNSTSAGDYDTCLIYRIQKSGNVFSASLINTIETDLTTYGTSWCVDVNELTISQVGYKNGTYLVTSNNPTYFWKWKLPTFNDIISGNTITLYEKDCVETTEIVHVMLQAAHAEGGNVWITCNYNDKQMLFVVDLKQGQVVSRIPLSDNQEVEGVTVYNNKIYVSHRYANSGDIPVKIYEITV